MDIREKYNAWHSGVSQYEEASYTLSHPWHIMVSSCLPDLNGLRVLEIGCGRGDFAIWLALKAPTAKIYAIDFSDEAIQLARARADQARVSISFSTCDAQALEYKEQAFDLVISCECLEHVESPKKMIAEIHRVLALNGKFIITTENYFNGMIVAWLRTWATGAPFNSGAGIQPIEHFFLYWRVRRMIESAGLVVSRTDSNHYQWLLLPKVSPSRLCTVEFNSPVLKRLFRPFGRHYAFWGTRSV